MANVKGQFNINIAPFEGKPDILKHFFGIIRDLSNINKWSNDHTILFFQTKLAGAALEYYIQNEESFKLMSLDELQTEFERFFNCSNKTLEVSELNNLTLLPQENIVNLSHRLNVLARKVYDLDDKNALDKIKFIKLMSLLPSNIRMKLKEENVKSYEQAITRAQELQNIFASENILNNKVNVNSENEQISQQLSHLAEKINKLTFTNVSPDNVHRESQHYENNKKSRDFRENYKQRVNRNNKFQPVQCQICNRFNHRAPQCFEYKKLLRNNEQNKHSTRIVHRRSDFGYRQNRPASFYDKKN